MDVLLLGGTQFLGKAIARELIARRHAVTCVARGSAAAAPGAVLIRADRDHDDALVTVADRNWDAVIDLTRQPVHARGAVRDLTARHWIFVSTSSVYARNDLPDRDESAQTVDALRADYLTDAEQYGPAKVACEAAYRTECASHTIIRSGLIGGHGDHTGRSGYYPWRFAHPTGADVLVPDPTFPVALVDVDDLSAWIADCAEQRHHGTFNATGPTTDLAEVLALSKDLVCSRAQIRELTEKEVSDAGIASWMGPKSLPLWVGEPEWRYAATLDTAAARAHGFRTRPLHDTLAAAFAYEETRTEPRLAGLSDDEEMSVRRAISG